MGSFIFWSFLIIILIAACHSYILVFIKLDIWQPLAACVGIVLLTIILIKLAKKIVNIRYKHPSMNGKQKKLLKEAEMLDNKNREENEHNKQVAQQQWDDSKEARHADIDSKLEKLTIEFDDLTGKVREHINAIDAADVLCEDDKNVPTIDALISIMETHRADCIKEALQIYDTMQANNKLIALEQKKVELQKEQMRQEKIDREKRLKAELDHQIQMEIQMSNIADSKAKAAKELDFISWQIHTMNH